MADNNNHKFENKTFGYLSQLFRLAYARVGNIEDAEDIVQSTYLKAFQGFDRLKGDSNVSAWLNQILINTIRDHFRKKGRLPATTSADDEDLDDNADYSEIGPEEILCDDEIDPALVQAFSAMPEQMASVFLLREMNDASYEEIASILEIPKGTVMSRLSRARTFLRKRLIGKREHIRSQSVQ